MASGAELPHWREYVAGIVETVLLLCDLDDTVLDRASTFERWALSFVSAWGLGPRAVAQLIEIDERGYQDREEFAGLVSDQFGIEPPLTAASFRAAFAPLFECEEEVVESLEHARREGARIAIVTNGEDTQLRKVEAAGLLSLVDCVCVSQLEGCRKPDKRLVTIAAERVGETLNGAWLVGDNADTDIAAAVNAGIRSVWLHHGRTWTRTDFTPTAIATTFAEAVATVLASAS